MCFLICAHKSHRDYPLIVAANRDEFHARPSREAQFWNDEPYILAGRDLQAGGTWLGITRQGRIAAVTNFHEQAMMPLPPLSRGALVSDFLRSHASPEEYAQYIIHNGNDYQGFTLVFGTVDTLHYCSNRTNTCEQITPGIHGLSNHTFNDNSSKVSKGREAMKKLLSQSDSLSPDDMFSLLSDRTQASDPELAVHGDKGEAERIYSPVFIIGKEFGTRCSTAILIDSRGSAHLSERTFSPEGAPIKTVEYQFLLSREKYS